MEVINDIISSINGVLWGWPMIILLLGTHIYLTIILRFPQRKIFKAIKLSVTKDPGSEGDVSQFGALATALAATIGTGHIVGVGTAIALGGPGAVFWCWLTGVFGISTKYAEGLLAIKYRVKTSNGKMLGGPMYALERGLGWKWMGVLFALFCALASFGIGCTVQANAISTLSFESYQIPTYVMGAIICLLTALVIIGGVHSIARVCGALVPFMAVFYIVGCIYIMFINSAYLLPALKLIMECAFNPSAAGGGFVVECPQQPAKEDCQDENQRSVLESGRCGALRRAHRGGCCARHGQRRNLVLGGRERERGFPAAVERPQQLDQRERRGRRSCARRRCRAQRQHAFCAIYGL